MPQPSAPPAGANAPGDVSIAGVAGTVATTGAAAAATGASATGIVASGVAAAQIMTGFIAFLAALREQHREWLARQLAARGGTPDDIAQVLATEMQLEQEFARNAADRVASKLPAALAITDPQLRAQAIQQILDDEKRFAQQRDEAMAARAYAAIARAKVRRVSPLGAFWQLGHAQNHTAGCLFMAGKFWPWAVLDRVHPPRHYGCTSSLISYGAALRGGLMTPGDVPDTAAAVRAAAGVVMEADEAEAVLAEVLIRDRLVEQGVSALALARIPFRGMEVIDGATEALPAAA